MCNSGTYLEGFASAQFIAVYSLFILDVANKGD